jgi:hypothetical protein
MYNYIREVLEFILGWVTGFSELCVVFLAASMQMPPQYLFYAATSSS